MLVLLLRVRLLTRAVCATVLLLCVRALMELRGFKPDVIIAIGGGSPMDAAKLMWLMYEQPDIKFEEVAARFMVSALLLSLCERLAACSVLALGCMQHSMCLQSHVIIQWFQRRHSLFGVVCSAGHPQAYQCYSTPGQAGTVCRNPHHLWNR
jgi:hypothetical protein